MCERVNPGGARVFQSVKCLTLGFGSGHDLRVMGSSPESGYALSGEPASLSPSALPPTCALSLSQINKILGKKKKKKKESQNEMKI